MRPIERIRRICGLWLLLLLPAAIMAQGHVYSYDDKDVIDGFRWTRVWTDERKYGVRDKKGREVLPMEFDFITYDSRFHGFITKLNVNSSEGFYTRTGKCVIPHVRGYDDIYIREDDKIGYYFEVEKDGYVGICDGKGNEIIKPDKYTGVNSFLPGDKEHPFFCVELNGKYGVCDAVGNEVVPPIYPGWLYDSGEDRWWYLDGYERVDVDAVRKSSDYNPFKENRVNKLKFYADFGGEEAPNSLIPLPTAPPAEERLAETDTEEDKSVEELVAEAKALTKTLNDLTAQAQGTSGSSDAGKTRRPTVAEVVVDTEPYDENDRLADDESFVKRLIRNNRSGDAFGYLQAELKDDYPSDPNVQFGYATLLQELGIALNNEGMAAAYSLNLAKAAVATSQIQAAKALQIQLLGTAAIKGHQGAQLMLQVMGAAAKSYSAPASSAPSYDNNNGGSGGRKKRCSLCNGKGWISGSKTTTYGNLGTTWCEECGREVPTSHSHDRCPSCGGTGYVPY